MNLQNFKCFKNVFCFTPKGAVIKLPKKATPIDFAYAVHTKMEIAQSDVLLMVVKQHFKQS